MSDMILTETLPAALVTRTGGFRSVIAQLTYDRSRPYEVFFAFKRQNSSNDFHNCQVAGRDEIAAVYLRNEERPGLEKHWAHLRVDIGHEVLLQIPGFDLELFLDATYKRVPAGCESEFMLIEFEDDEDDSAPHLAEGDWRAFNEMLGLACFGEQLSATDWDKELGSL